MLPSVFQDVRGTRCHVRLNAPVQELEHNIMQYMNSPVMVDADPSTSATARPWQSANGISSANDECPFPQTLQVQPLTFRTTLSGSETKCTMVRGLWNAVLSRVLSSYTWKRGPTKLSLIPW